MIIVKRLNDSRQQFFDIAFRFISVLFYGPTPLFNYLSSHKYSVAKNLITV
jgi:hypothetical protein